MQLKTGKTASAAVLAVAQNIHSEDQKLTMTQPIQYSTNHNKYITNCESPFTDIIISKTTP